MEEQARPDSGRDPDPLDFGIADEYTRRFGRMFPVPVNVPVEALLAEAKRALDRGTPIPDDFDWFEGAPPGALT